MEGGLGSDSVVKKKSSSGCLVIKKEGEGGGNGEGSGSSKKNKRARVLLSDSGSSSSDELLETMRRKSREKIGKGEVVYKRRGGGNGNLGSRGELKCEKRKGDDANLGSRGELECEKRKRDGENSESRGELECEKRKRDGENSGSRGELECEKRKGDDGNLGSRGELECEKKSGLDLFEFDEYDEFEGFEVRNEYWDGNSKSKRGRERGGSSRKVQKTPEEPKRLQGKNGLLKVTGNSSNTNSKKKKKKKIKTDLFRDDCEEEHDENQKSSNSEVAVKKEHLQTSCNSESQTRKSFMGKSTADDDLNLDETNNSVKLDSPSVHNSVSSRPMKEERRSSTQNLGSRRGKENDNLSESTTPVRSKIETRFPSESSTPPRGKVVGGGSTEKQQLRETIREMLLEAGWTIDYRPRKNRDYLDAVYIHPRGTTYWSITKAYEALQREFDDQQGRSKSAGLPSSFVPISEDLISKLTRQTQRKIEEKMKKRREDGMPKTSKQTEEKEHVEEMDSDQPEETLSAFIRKNRKSSKNKTHDLCHENGSESKDYSCKRTTKGDGVEKSLNDTKNRLLEGKLGSVIERCTLRIRDLNKSQNSETDGYVAYSGKRTVLAWLVDSGVVQSGKKVQYMNHRRTRVKLEGWITKEGIHCSCCSKIVTVSKFELHAGSKLGRPFKNIFLESGVSLLQCQIDAWNQQDESERQDFYTIGMVSDDPDDDTCGTCGDGGDLICCDSCPSTFHQSCLEFKMVPVGDWHCSNCVCKFCGTASRNDVGCDNNLLRCSLCDRKYHKLCSTDNGTTPVDSSSRTTQFCSHECEKLCDHVSKILGVKRELETGFFWSLIRRTDIDSDVANSGFAQRVECNSKLAVARSVMDECFLPIIDRRSGINMIHNVLYNCGANFPRLNYSNFYTAILEKGDDIISVACIRIHGTRLAEMPFIGTRHIYRRQGMCSQLLSAIELALSSFKVEKLLIPAVSEHTSTWTTSFGFSPLEKDLKKEIKSLNMLVFPGTDMLQKQLMEPMTNDAKTTDLTLNHCQPPALTRKYNSLTSGDDEDERKDAKVHLNKNLDKSEVDTDSLDSAAPSNITGPFAPFAPDSTSNSGIQFSVVESAADQTNQAVETATSQPSGTIKSPGDELCAVPKDNEVSDAQILSELDGEDFVHPDVSAHANVNIQSTSCEAKTTDHDITDSSLDNVQTDVNGMPSLLEDGNVKEPLSFSTDLNKPGDSINGDVVLETVGQVATDAETVGVKALTDTSEVDGVGNHGDSNADTSSFEHAIASANSKISEEINEQHNFSCASGGGSIKSENCVDQSMMKSEPPEAV